MDINLFFCEGPHDISFLVRLLKDNNHIDYSDRPINSIPDKDLQRIIFNSLSQYKYNQDKNIFTQKPAIPSILFKEDQYILIYSTNGHLDKNVNHPEDDIFLRIVKDFQSIKKSDLFNDKINNIRISLFYDADDDIDKKIKNIDKYLSEINIIKMTESISHNKIQELSDLRSIGCFIFKIPDDTKGCLEDILIPILENNHGVKVLDSYSFLDTHFDNTISKRDFDRKKATIGIIGQLEKSGVANSSIISQTSLFKEKLTTPSCLEVYEFIKGNLAY